MNRPSSGSWRTRRWASSPIRRAWRAVTGAFLGLEMYEGVDPEGAERAFEAREQPAAPAGVLDERGPVARRAVRHRLRRTKKVQDGA
ncbi:hypothetical protein [Streptomyces rubiginosohelvolus]|uniref:hypothetical protein n=1 Tax=Streptomyces rubiginosohelvolus TaxID=67362 RepID=UPI0035D96674